MPAIRLAIFMSIMLPAACTPPIHFTRRTVPEKPSSAPIEIVERLPVTRARVAGRPVALVLDLGAAHALTLGEADLAAAGARPTGERVRFVDAAGHRLGAGCRLLSALAWAGVTWRGVRVVEQVFHPDFAPPVQHGVLGRPLFEGLRLELDFGRGQVTSAPGRSRCGPRSVAADLPGLPADVVLGVPFLERHVVVIDFGAGCLEVSEGRPAP